MAEILLAVLTPVLDALIEKASKEVGDFLKQRKLDVKVLKKLERRINSVRGLLEDAEDKQITNAAVKKWLDDLKDVAYEADDFLDEITYQAGELLEIEAGPNTCSDQVRNFFSSLNPCRKGIGELEPRLEEILATLEDLLRQKDVLKLEKRNGVIPSSLLLSQERLRTPKVDESGVYGRNDDKERILSLLLTDDECLGVVPIVGMGGIGKTTLSQIVYKDSRVIQRFDKLRAWVCVSEESDILKLTKNILKEIGSSDCDSMTPNQLQDALEEKVKGERILLVLDDIWNNINWEFLFTPMKSAAQGSKVLVTTREERIVSVVSTVPSYCLKELSEDDCWSLFAKHALYSDAYADLEEIGRKIVRKCKGLPLAAKTIGSLLRSERRVKKWEDILESNIWDSKFGYIIPALRLSYHYLPPHLKQCFVYCAMFPKDFQFKKEKLSLLWMAEGFIVQHSNETREMEEIGEEYFEDLLSRSFFQKYESKEDMFVMHDLMNDLAKSIAGEFCYNNVDGAISCQPTERTRHLFCEDKANDSEELESLAKAKQSRTIIHKMRDVNFRRSVNFLPRLRRLPSLRRLRVLHIDGDHLLRGETNISDVVSSAKHLRFLQLESLEIQSLPEDLHTLPYLQTLKVTHCWHITGLPDSIGNLKHLRHLNLKNVSGLESVPDSIGNLKDLRHLCLERASQLKSLPDSIGNLKNLIHLDVGDTSLERLPDSICGLHRLQHLSLCKCLKLLELPAMMSDLVSLCHLDIRVTNLKSMPPQMGKLVKLQVLIDFIVGRDGGGSSIAELGKLRHLQGELTLQNLQNVTDAKNALEANLNDKSRLERLDYEWEWYQVNLKDKCDTDDGSAEISVFQHLRPHVNVKCTEILGYRGINFPNWVGDSSFSNIVQLSLGFCKYCSRLPPLGQLTSLENLSIFRFDSLVSVGAEFYGDSKSIQPFRSLKKLEFGGMPKLREWNFYGNKGEDDGSTVFPLLQNLMIYNCPELEMAFTQGIFSSTLQKLKIKDCNKIISGRVVWDLRKCSSLSNFELDSSGDIQSFPGRILLPSTLENIMISDLHKLKSLDYAGLQRLTSLKRLIIYRCPYLGCIPDEGLPKSLNYLSITHCPELEKRCQRERGEDWPKISHIPNIDVKSIAQREGRRIISKARAELLKDGEE